MVRKRKKRSKVCEFCKNGVFYIDYKDTDTLSKYLNERGKIEPRRKTGVCTKHQRQLARAIKRARIIGLLPFVKTPVIKISFK